MTFLAILGREPEISLAELCALYDNVKQISSSAATFESASAPDLNHLGGTLKIAAKLNKKPLDYLKNLPEGKITFAISDYSKNANAKSISREALKLKQILVRHGRSVRVVMNRENNSPVLSTATSLHNGFGAGKLNKVELVKIGDTYWRVLQVQNIDAYARRDQARPARDARVGMLPPKLAQILINLCGKLPENARILDPFCGTGVLLQEASLMGYNAYGTDLNPRMVEFSKKNLAWLTTDYLSRNAKTSTSSALNNQNPAISSALSHIQPQSAIAAPSLSPKNSWFVEVGDATSHTWTQPIDAVAAETYLGLPFSKIPTEIELKKEQQTCREIISGFLKNLSNQIKTGTPVVIAVPAWHREDGEYKPLFESDFSGGGDAAKGLPRKCSDFREKEQRQDPLEKSDAKTPKPLDEIEKLGYNEINYGASRLLYHREGQIVAREIIILRKK